MNGSTPDLSVQSILKDLLPVSEVLTLIVGTTGAVNDISTVLCSSTALPYQKAAIRTALTKESGG